MAGLYPTYAPLDTSSTPSTSHSNTPANSPTKNISLSELSPARQDKVFPCPTVKGRHGRHCPYCGMIIHGYRFKSECPSYHCKKKLPMPPELPEGFLWCPTCIIGYYKDDDWRNCHICGRLSQYGEEQACIRKEFETEKRKLEVAFKERMKCLEVKKRKVDSTSTTEESSKSPDDIDLTADDIHLLASLDLGKSQENGPPNMDNSQKDDLPATSNSSFDRGIPVSQETGPPNTSVSKKKAAQQPSGRGKETLKKKKVNKQNKTKK